MGEIARAAAMKQGKPTMTTRALPSMVTLEEEEEVHRPTARPTVPPQQRTS